MRLASCCRRSRLVLRRRRSQGKVKNQEVAITGLLDDVCDQANMKRFKFIPPKMVKGCQSFMDEYDGEFEKPLFDVDLATIEALTRETRDNRPGLNALQDAVCAQTVHVCKGVTVNPPRIEKPKVNIDGAPKIKTAEDAEEEAEAKKKAKPKKKGKKKKAKGKEEL